MNLSKIAVIAPGLVAGSPAQQLLDRLLAGFPAGDRFQSRAATTITAFAPGAPDDLLALRSRDHGLTVSNNPADAVAGADAALVVWPGVGHAADPALLDSVLVHLPPGSSCFVHGLLGRTRGEAGQAADRARARGIRLTAGTALATAPRLPDVTLQPGTTADEALIVVQGPSPEALLHGVHGLLPDLDRARVLFDLPLIVRAFEGDAVWSAETRGEWPMDLLAAALSRSNNPQGDPIRDGRTQDLLGLGLVPKLARNPRCWITRHPDGCRSTILALDGVVADVNLAIRTRRGAVASTQLYQAPPPNQAAFHPFAAAVTAFFRGEPAPWSPHRAVGAATWHGALRGDPGVLNVP